MCIAVHLREFVATFSTAVFENIIDMLLDTKFTNSTLNYIQSVCSTLTLIVAFCIVLDPCKSW